MGREHVSAHGEFGSNISYPLRHILLFFLHMHGIRLHIYRSSFLSLHCIASLHRIYVSTQYTSILVYYYMRDTRWPTPPGSGGMGNSPLRSETNAAYLGVFVKK